MPISVRWRIIQVKMKVILPQENILTAVKRDDPATDLTPGQMFGTLGKPLLKEIARSSSVKGTEVMNTQLPGICGSCILGQMDEKPLKLSQGNNSQVLELYMPTSYRTMNCGQWSHTKFSLIIHNNFLSQALDSHSI